MAQRFEAQCRLAPQAWSIGLGLENLTYDELNRRANRLSHQLIGMGVGPEVLVGICLERSVEMIVAMLAVVKAGGAYLPLDPGTPSARLQSTLVDAEPRVVLTDSQLAGLLGTAVPVLRLDANPELPEQETSPGDRGVRPGHAAYVIYTSGSTGQPKGAVITQECVLRLLTATEQWYGFSERDVWTMFHSFAFDFSVWEIWGALLYGGRLVIVPKLVSRSPGEFLDLLVRERVTVLNQTPSAFYQLMQADAEQPELGDRLSLKWVIFGGEALSLSQLGRWYARHAVDEPRLVNMYGITETTVHVTYQPLTAEVASRETASLIGEPIPDLRVYVLDERLRPVPTGVSGEMYVAGPGLARGYLKRPGLTAERFLADPFGGPGARMYRSGDLARPRVDGTLEYLGRGDQQVKLRGHRIELGEIEAVLAGDPGVSQVAVVLRDAEGTDPSLVAYVVPDPRSEPVLARLAGLEQREELPVDARYVLPNGLLIRHQNRSETEFVYEEVFRQECYLRHGIALGPRAVVFDVGANIGLFTLFVRRRFPDSTVFAFEPIPPLFDTLRVNAELYGGDTRLYCLGLSEQEERATFTWYRHNSVISGRFADLGAETAVVKSVLRQQAGQAVLEESALDQLVASRLQSEQFECQLRPLSAILAEAGVEQIDLLKIDVEKSEWLVLMGIEPRDWDRIRQVVVEVHDEEGRLERVTSLLRSVGFTVVLEQDDVLQGTPLYSVYARRPGLEEIATEDSPPAHPELTQPEPWLTRLRNSCEARLPGYMVPRDFVLLPGLPLTTNGKLDRNALPAPRRVRAATAGECRAPRNPLEAAMCRAFGEMLNLPAVGIDDSFFALGGHSLLATRLAARVRRDLGREVPIRVVFEHPTVAGLAAWLANQDPAGHDVRPRLTREVRPARLPLSPAQQRMWFLQELQGAQSTYHIPLVRRLRGPLDLDALRLAVGDLLERHEGLRTVFPEEGGIPWQEVREIEPLELPVTVEDVTAEPLEGRLVSAANQPFDLARELPVRFRVWRLSREEHVLLIVLHHIAADGTSLIPLWRDLSQAYAARLQGSEPGWAPLPVQYADYTIWHRRWLGSLEDPASAAARELAYWRRVLADLPEELPLPTDRTRPRVASYRGGTVPVTVEASLVSRLEELGRSEGASLFMVLQGAVAVLLSRLGGGTDIPLGSPIAGRLDEALQDQVGFYVNTLVLRTDLSGAPDFREVLRRVREFDLAAFAHQELPFEQLVQALQPARSMARHPLFQVMVVLQNTGRREESLPGLSVAEVPLPQTTSKFDLLWNLEETAEGGLAGSLEYATDLYDHETAVRLVRRLQDLLEQVADAPGRRITTLCVLLDQEARQLQTWGHGPAPAGDDLDISTMFARQVTANPRGLAVAAGAVGLSYSQLDQRVESWARQLADWGVGPETIVAVHLGRTADFVVALLAILRAGGAYLPVDEEVPETRFSQILTAARPVLLLTSRSLSGRCPVDIRTVCVEDLGDSAGLVPVGDWPVAQRDQAAYLIHTSGSTGRPKGIVGRHGTLANLILWQSAGQRPVRVAQFTAVGFDVSPQEILTALLTGGSLHVVDAETRLDPERFIEFLVQERITDLFVPFVVLENLARVALELGRNLPELREVHQAGEALRLSPAIRQFFTAHPGCRLHNHYGPAETHVVTACTLPADPEAWPDQATIGIPISGIQAYVLDDGLEPVPPGVVGELYFAGEGLNRGYLRQPGETAARFVADPRSRAPGGRMYRTGDLARWQLSGDLEFLGRVDHQVKIRGVRVEPGEIEAVLLDEGSIVQAVVVPWNDDEVGTQLAAYVVPRETGRIDEESLVRFLSSRLPTAMIPASIVEVEQIPLTTNGKLDRNALPAPRRVRAATAGDSRAPRNSLEAAVCQAFGEILNLPAVGIDDSFFALGGHSLLATRLAARVRRDLGREVPIRVVFEHPTAAGLAAWLESQDPAGHAVRPPLMREERPARLPLSAAQQRMWFLQRLEGPGATYHIPLARTLRGALDTDALRLAVGDLLERHEGLRTVFPEEGGIPWQEVREIEPLELPVTVEDVTAEQLEGRLVSAANQPFDLARELPVRFRLWRLGPKEHVLLIVLHHIAADGTSLIPLWRDLSQAYAARLQGSEPGWAPLPVQYADYTLWQQRWLGTTSDAKSVLSRELEFWRRSLAELPEELALPTDRPRPRVSSHRGGVVTFAVPGDLRARLQRLAEAEGASLFMVLQGAVAVLLSRLGGGTDIPLGSPIAGRLDEALQDQVGFYVNTLVLRTDLSGAPDFREVLRRVREFDLAAFAHQELPFEQLVQALQPARSMARHPLFQVMVVLQNTGRREESLPGLSVAEVPLPQTTSKFDLLWNLEETAEGGLTGSLEYAHDLYDEKTARTFAARLVRVLEQVTETPQQSIADLELLIAGERELLATWGRGPEPQIPALGIHGLFQSQVQIRPEATALIWRDESWSYRKLDDVSTAIARQLQGAGVGLDDVVGLSVKRSPWQVALLLGILKAGAAYLPLEPRWPDHRLRQMFELAGAICVVVDQEKEQFRWEQLATRAVRITSETVTSHHDGFPTASVSGETLAYVTFTSGSTGIPKGVAIPHRGVVRLVWQPSYVELTPGQRVAHFAPLAFDASTFEIWGPLLNGGTCVLMPEDGWELRDLEHEFRQHEVDTAWLTASLFNTIITDCPGILHSVRQLLTGGEVLSVPHVRKARDLLGQEVRLINGYGPTEGTTFACCHDITANDLSRDFALPIGRPINHTQLLVLDERLRLVPPGVTGELYLGGDGLARGYQGRPDWTAERFLSDPTGMSTAGRIYRTGDLARWNHSGVLEFLGRADLQVKIRGHRIEPGEVESVLLALPGVSGAVALVVGDVSRGLQRLVAHVNADQDCTLDPSSLRQLLRDRLPDYLVPSTIVIRDALPVTENGKIDRRALEKIAIKTADTTESAERRTPRTPTELTFARLWCELLSRESVDCETSFFTLGGHSLLAVRLFHQIERDLGARLPLESLFHNPTIEGLAGLIDGAGTSPVAVQGTPELIVPLRAGGTRSPLFLLPSATGNILFWQRLLPHLPEGLPVLGVVPQRDGQGNPVWESLAQAVAPMCDAVNRSQPTGPLQLLGYSAGAYMAQELARQLEERGREVGFLGLIDTGPGQFETDWADRLSEVPGYVRNLGYWMVDNNHRTSWRNLWRRWDRLRKRLRFRPASQPVLGHYRTLEKKFLETVAQHPTRPVRVPITLFRARCQSPWHYRSDSLGWTQLGCHAEIVRFAGVDHFDIVSESHFPQVAAEIVPRLAPECSPGPHGT